MNEDEYLLDFGLSLFNLGADLPCSAHPLCFLMVRADTIFSEVIMEYPQICRNYGRTSIFRVNYIQPLIYSLRVILFGQELRK